MLGMQDIMQCLLDKNLISLFFFVVVLGISLKLIMFIIDLQNT